MSFFKGTSTDQDPRFKDKQAMLRKRMTFPPSFEQKVDMRKVEIAVMKPWIAKKVIELLGFEDDVLIEYINSLLEDPDNPIIDAKNLQILLTGFLEKKTAPFMEHLWSLLLSAQSNPLKVPTELLEQKKKEMKERAEKEAVERRKQQELEEIRQRERNSRGGPGGGGQRGGYGNDRRGGGYIGGGGRDRFDDRDRERGGPPPRGGYEGRGRGGGYQGGNGRDSGYGRGGPRDDFRRPPPGRGRSLSRSRSPRSRSPRSRSPYSRSPSRSRSPPPRRTRRRSSTPPASSRRARRRSSSPPASKRDRDDRGGNKRRYSRSPSRSRSRSRSRSISRSRSPPPPRRRGEEPPTRRDNGKRKAAPSRSPRSRSVSRSVSPPPKRRVGGKEEQGDRVSKSRWAKEDDEDKVDPKLKQRENELKEGLLRKKVVASRTSKDSTGAKED